MNTRRLLIVNKKFVSLEPLCPLSRAQAFIISIKTGKIDLLFSKMSLCSLLHILRNFPLIFLVTICVFLLYLNWKLFRTRIVLYI